MIGKRLVDAGALDAPSDVFFLRRETLEGVVEGWVSVAKGLPQGRPVREVPRRLG